MKEVIIPWENICEEKWLVLPIGLEGITSYTPSTGINTYPMLCHFYPATRTHNLFCVSFSHPKIPYFKDKEDGIGGSVGTHKKKTISTPNIFATSQRLPDTLDQYFSSSRCAPCTLSTTSSVFASIRWIISLCSDTMVASCPKIPPSSWIVRSIASIASPRWLIYTFCGCASSIINSCWSLTGFRLSRSCPGPGLPRVGVWYKGESDCFKEGAARADTEETKFSVREREAWMFFVRTSSTSLKFEETSVSFPCRRKTTFLLCSPSWFCLGFWVLVKLCRELICWFRDERSCLIMKVNSLISKGLSSNSVFRFATARH